MIFTGKNGNFGSTNVLTMDTVIIPEIPLIYGYAYTFIGICMAYEP